MSTSSAGTNRIWPNWWKFAGIDGLIWAVLFIVGSFALQGETPSRTDSVESIRAYFLDDGDMYLAGDYVLAIGFVIFFLPYVIGLRWYLGSREGSPPIWSWMSFTGGVFATAIGAMAGVFWGALALTMERNPELDDSVIILLMDLDAYAYNLLQFGIALFIGSAGFIMLRTGALWRWPGLLGMIGAILFIIGAAWPIDGDDEGAIAIVGFIGFPLSLLFVLITSIGMILDKEPTAELH